MFLPRLLLLACAVSAPASASLLFGETVRVTHELPNVGAIVGGPTDVVVGAGVEIPLFIGIYSVDLDDTTITFTFPNSCCGGFGSNTFNGAHFFDLNGTIPDIYRVSIVSQNIGFNASRITFDFNNVYVNFAGLNPDPSTGSLVLELATPEPGTWVLAGLGVLAIFARRRCVGRLA